MKFSQKIRIGILIFLFFISGIAFVKTHYDIEKKLYRVFQPLEPQQLAKISVEKYLLEGKLVIPEKINNQNKINSGIFVTIFNKNSGLRGCLGSVPPNIYSKNTAKEIAVFAVLSAINDKRFAPVRKDELKELIYTVDILEKPEEVKSYSNLNPKIYGIIVSTQEKQGVILPNIDGVSDIKTQIKFAKINGGIQENEKVIKIQRFKTNHYI